MTKASVLAVSALAAGAATALFGSQAIAHVAATPDSEQRNVALRIGGSEAAGFFKEATGFDSESEVTARPR